MTTKQALDTINGAEIMSLNVPIRKLQSAVLALMSAARRCLRYDKQVDDDGNVVSTKGLEDRR